MQLAYMHGPEQAVGNIEGTVKSVLCSTNDVLATKRAISKLQ